MEAMNSNNNMNSEILDKSTDMIIVEVLKELEKQGYNAVPQSYLIELVMSKTGKSESTIKYHLKKLRIEGLIKRVKKQGRWYISLNK